ncbi:malate synthase G [Egicoccus sp. AB-alg6-2]|uniref:malate synthase G n=1 Tax=Egicoccus sp. AB-alg6-2 TaxID=3242692 RepID=UPI00359E5108
MPTRADTTTIAGLTVDRDLQRFVDEELLPDSGVDTEGFWPGLAELIARFTPRNRELLAHRADLQARIDQWHRDEGDGLADPAAYRRMLDEIGYLRPDPDDPRISGDVPVDPEIGEIAGPQLVVPVTNARYAVNAANARWGSLYDALYGTDALGDLPPAGAYDPARGARVVAWAADFLDTAVPLRDASHADATGYVVRDGALRAEIADGSTGLLDPGAFAGHLGDADAPESVLLEHHGLGVQLLFDRDHPVGAEHPAGLADVLLEAAVTVIMDLEDSVAAVDAADKVLGYRNWLGLMRGDLSADVDKDGRSFVRRLEPDPVFTAPDGSARRRRRRSLLLVRNVGLLMTTPAILDGDGDEVFEGLLDSVFTVLAACHDRRRDTADRNSAVGAVYVVKPKLHGPDEVAFTCEVFAAVEELLGLPANTIRLGLMDEERRTSANLPACVAVAGARLAFINTGFLDRTGDEMHTAMEAGAMVRKADMKSQPWLQAYEDRNVDVGLAAGLRGRAQIGKGMWAAPDRMQAMLEEKIGHPKAGANCAWVPSPTAATLHATHYHLVDVHERQAELLDRSPASLDDLLTLPLADGQPWSAEERRAEVDNNVQGILGYVVRWVDQGIGVSKVPDLSGTALMEDRATCRISSQHVANWLRHGVVTEDEVMASFRRMAAVVDEQNAGDPAYRPMAPGFDGPAFQAAVDLVFEGREQPSGYTEPILHRRRQEVKQAAQD